MMLTKNFEEYRIKRGYSKCLKFLIRTFRKIFHVFYLKGRKNFRGGE
ncbi:MAG: hypothetical protein IJT06_03925 [Selenomonadaceae bacterium]|nr:hypothetical protein [Selenomonadaceae bacterium]